MLGKRSLAEVGRRAADQWHEEDRATQSNEPAEELDLPPLMGGHRSSYA